VKEKNIQNLALIAVGARSDCMVWRNHVGCYRSMDDPTRIVRVGTPGAPDALAVVSMVITPDMVGKTIGVAVGPEFKNFKGRQSEQQKNWQAAFEKRGGIYKLIRSETEMVTFINDVTLGKYFR
jgi:hypothetical protein